MKNSQSQKKKYRVSKFYAGTYIGALILLLVSIPTAAVMYRAAEGGLRVTARVLEVAFTLDFLFFFKLTFFDFPFAKFEYDDKSMTMHVGTKNYTLLWEDCVDFGLLDLEVELGANTYWVYCSTNRALTQKCSPKHEAAFLLFLMDIIFFSCIHFVDN